jgi:hypothetical protein
VSGPSGAGPHAGTWTSVPAPALSGASACTRTLSRTPPSWPGSPPTTGRSTSGFTHSGWTLRRGNGMSGPSLPALAQARTHSAVRRRSRARTRAGAGGVPCRDAGMPSVLRKHIVGSRWPTLVGNGLLRSSCGLAADWAARLAVDPHPGPHSPSVTKRGGPPHALVRPSASGCASIRTKLPVLAAPVITKPGGISGHGRSPAGRRDAFPCGR